MPIYILLSTLSQQGVQTLKSNPDRLREVNRDVEELGAKVLHQWATLGEFDFINVVEAPDTATIAKVSVALAARGSTKIQALPGSRVDRFCQNPAAARADDRRVRPDDPVTTRRCGGPSRPRRRRSRTARPGRPRRANRGSAAQGRPPCSRTRRPASRERAPGAGGPPPRRGARLPRPPGLPCSRGAWPERSGSSSETVQTVSAGFRVRTVEPNPGLRRPGATQLRPVAARRTATRPPRRTPRGVRRRPRPSSPQRRCLAVDDLALAVLNPDAKLVGGDDVAGAARLPAISLLFCSVKR